MAGELDFEAALRARVALLAGLDEAVLDRARERMRLTPGRPHVRAHAASGWATASAIGQRWLHRVHRPPARASCGVDHAFANELEIVDGRLTGGWSGRSSTGARKAELLARGGGAGGHRPRPDRGRGRRRQRPRHAGRGRPRHRLQRQAGGAGGGRHRGQRALPRRHPVRAGLRRDEVVEADEADIADIGRRTSDAAGDLGPVRLPSPTMGPAPTPEPAEPSEPPLAGCACSTSRATWPGPSATAARRLRRRRGQGRVDEGRGFAGCDGPERPGQLLLPVRQPRQAFGHRRPRPRRGRELMLRMRRRFDVLVENFRPGVMEALGLGAESAPRPIFPRLVYCGISGYGADGPYRKRPGFDQVAQGMSGFMSVTGTEESGPTRAGIAIADLLAGIFAAHGIQLALLARAQTGEGQVVHTSLLEAMIGVMSWAAGMYFESGQAPGSRRTAPPAGRAVRPLQGARRLPEHRSGQRRACGRSSRRALGKPEWTARPALRRAGQADRAARGADRGDRGGARHARGRPLDRDAERVAGIPTGPVLDMAQVFTDPQVLARQMLVELPHPQVGTLPHDRAAGEAVEHARCDHAQAAAARRAHRRGAPRVWNRGGRTGRAPSPRRRAPAVRSRSALSRCPIGRLRPVFSVGSTGVARAVDDLDARCCHERRRSVRAPWRSSCRRRG